MAGERLGSVAVRQPHPNRRVRVYMVKCDEYITPPYTTRVEAEDHLDNILAEEACDLHHAIIERYIPHAALLSSAI